MINQGGEVMPLCLIVSIVAGFIAARLRDMTNKRRKRKGKDLKPRGKDTNMPVVVWAISLVIMLFLVGPLVDAYCIPEGKYHTEITEFPIVQMTVDQDGHEKFISIRGEENKVQFVYAQETEDGVVMKGNSANELSINYDSLNPRITLRERIGFEHWTTWLYHLPWRQVASNKTATIYLPEGAADIY